MLLGAILHLHQMVPNCIDADLQPRCINCRSMGGWPLYTVRHASNFRDKSLEQSSVNFRDQCVRMKWSMHNMLAGTHGYYCCDAFS